MIHNSLLLRFGLKKMAEGSHCSARWHRRISNEHGDFKRKHPSHLRGKEIGLYYANRGKKRQREEINLDTEQFELINSFLDQKSPFGDENRVISSLIESLNCDKVKTYHHGNRAEFILKQNEELDQIFLKEKNEIDKGGKMQEFRKNLPAYKFKEKILDVLNKNQVVVICGETGCGKTTQVAQFILDDYISKGKGSLCSVVCTQPRRISAISVAERVTEERNSVCGRNGCAVGYQIRLENRRPRKQGSIMFCTPGILLQELQNNPHFYGYSHVILDEIHERDLNTDLLIIIIRQILKKNQDLRVILMSATLNADEISTYFGNCSIINIPGFTYPVQEFYLEDIVQNIGYNVTQAMKKNTKINGPKWKKYTSEGKRLLREAENVEIEQFNYFESIKNKYPHDVINTLQNLDLEKLPLNLYLNLIKHICKSQKQGAILVFLTGWMEIKDLHKLISNDPFFKTNKSKIIPLHSMMPTVNQKDIFERPPPGKILDVLNKNQVVVICGETGCGKTTQVAQFILDDYISKGKGSLCSVVCTQPRRISAISVAERVTEERNSVCGRNGCAVGYQIRLENRRPRKQGSIMFCTPGILLQELQNNPHFYGYSHVILDEIHERDLNTDLLIIIIRQILKKNQDLRVILMSATLNADEISTYFGNCSIINIPGFTYPVQEFYLEDIVQNIGYNVTQAMKKNTKINGPKWKKYTSEGKRLLREAENVEIEQFNYFESIKNKYPHDVINTLQNLDLEKLPLNLYLNLIKHICKSQKQGAILVFLTGWMEIKDLHKLISNDPFFKTNKSKIIPLHSMMPTVNQKDIFERPPPGVRKIILSTNIAETSITIDDVVYVINNGKAKISNYDEEKNLSTLQPEWISLANSKQRKGRAGRVQPGICYHAYTQYQHSKLRNYQLPEMLRTRLEQICLRIKLLKLGNISQFLSEAMNSPSSKAVEQSITILKQLNAFDDNEELTALGYHLARLPLDPQIGKMILLGSIFSCLDPILTVAASISFKDPFVFPLGKENLADIRKVELSNQTNSDHFAFINAVKGWEEAKSNGNVHRFVNHHFLSQNILKSLTDMKRQLAEYLVSLKFLDVPDEKDPRFNINSDNEQLIKAIICAGLYPNIIQCHNKKPKKQSRSDHYQQNKQKRLPRTRTQLEVVSLHPKSVNCKVDYFNSPWLVYHLKVKSTQIFIYDSTMVTALQLVFFGGQLDLVKDCGVELISIDKWIEFKVSHSKAKAIMNLRNLLNEFLAFKIKHPGATIWDPSESHFPMLTVIRDIVACNDF